MVKIDTLKRLKKTIPFGAAHTYKAYIREYPPPPSLQVLHSSLCQWNLDSGFLQLYSGFQSSGFQIQQPKFQIPQAKISRIQESLKGAKPGLRSRYSRSML